MKQAKRRLLSLLLTLSFCLALLPCFVLAEEPEGSIIAVEDAEGLQDQSGVISAPEAENGEEILEITVWVDDVVAEHTRQLIQAYNEAHQGEPQFSATVLERPLADAYGNLVNDPESAADLFLFPQDQIASLLNAGFLNRLDGDGAAFVREENAEGAVRAAEYRGDLYAYPITADNGFFLYYDRSVIPESDVDSLEAIIADCEAADKTFFFDAESGWYFSAFFFGTGCVSCWETDGENWSCTDNFDSEQGLAAAKGMKKLTDSDAFVNGSSAWDAFGEGNAAALVSGTWDYDTALEFLGDDLGATDLPSFTIDGQSYHMGSFSGSKLLGVKPQEDPDRSAALHDLARYLTSEEAQRGRFEAVHWGPSNLAAQQDPAVQANPALAALLKQSAYATPQGPVFASWWNIASSLSRSIQQAETEDELRAALQRYHQKVLDPDSVDPAYANGTCGDDLTWVLDGNTITISGTGEMWDWEWSNPAPWDAYRESILAVVIEEGVTGVGAFAFYDCGKLTSVTFSESLTSIGIYAFSNCSSLTCLSIPAGVTSIDDMAFGWCTNIEHILVDENNPSYKSENDILFSRDGSELILCSAAKSGICEVPTGVERICWAAFCGCDLDSVLLPDSLRYIESCAFFGSRRLTEITLPEGLIGIAGGAFEETGIREISFPATLREITGGNGDAIFAGTPLENIYVSPDNPYFCSVDGILFSKDRSELALFPTGRTGSYTVPEGVTSLGMKSFDCVPLTEVILPESLTRIGGNAFQFATNLQTLRIPSNVSEIERCAFTGTRLSGIRFDGNAPQFAEESFKGVTITAYYPENDPSWTEDVRQNYQGEVTWVPYVPGDVNEDGDLDAQDLMAMRKTLVGLNEELRELFTDLDGDGEVTILDLVRLRKLLAGLAD